MDNNVYNVDENDVREVGEIVEPEVEKVEAELVNDNKEENINIKGMVYAVASFVLGLISCGSTFMYDYSFIISMIMAVASCVFAGKYLFDGNKHKIFGKLAFAGFLLSLGGIILGIIRFILAVVAGVGVAFFRVLF